MKEAVADLLKRRRFLVAVLKRVLGRIHERHESPCYTVPFCFQEFKTGWKRDPEAQALWAARLQATVVAPQRSTIHERREVESRAGAGIAPYVHPELPEESISGPAAPTEELVPKSSMLAMEERYQSEMEERAGREAKARERWHESLKLIFHFDPSPTLSNPNVKAFEGERPGSAGARRSPPETSHRRGEQKVLRPCLDGNLAAHGRGVSPHG